MIVLDDIAEWTQNEQQHILTDEEILNEIRKPADTIEVDEETMEEESALDTHITHGSGLKSLNDSLIYIEQQPETTPDEIIIIKRLRDRASKKKTEYLRQKPITDFFK